jgi:hypothetical protein
MEVRHVLVYLLQNRRKHLLEQGRRCGRGWLDEFSSAPWFTGWRESIPEPTEPAPTSLPRFWLSREGWLRHGKIGLDELPRFRPPVA